MILEKSITNHLTNRNLTTASKSTLANRTLALCTLVLLACGAGCASTGTLQPHQAFRQATTPYQGYYQGTQPAYRTPGNFNAGSASDYSGYGGYNNSLPGYSQPSPVTGAYGNPFTSPYGNSTAGQTPVQGQGGYGQYSYPANAGYNYQPAYRGGFTSGSC